MGELIEMPVRTEAASELSSASPIGANPNSNVLSMPAPLAAQAPATDFAIWQQAPRERTVAYFPTYSAVSRAMQIAMRSWVREWFYANPDVLLRPHAAYPILVFQCTHPYWGRPSHTFTYDIQQTEPLNRAFASAAHRLGAELKALNTRQFSWFTREHYFAYRSKEVVKYVMKHRRIIYKMLNVETVLTDSLLKFALIDIPAMGLERALVLLRRAFQVQLHRFSEDFDLSVRTEELLALATETLATKLAADQAVAEPLPEAA